MPTPHIAAQPGDFAETILLPGDPLRAKYIADTYLTDVKQVNSIRNMFGYTGTYTQKATGKKQRVSVMGTGMGIASIQIYSTELIQQYGVKNLIRIGSCGAFSEGINCGDIVIGMGACSDNQVNRIRFKNYEFASIADFNLLRNAVAQAEKPGRLGTSKCHVGNIFSSDFFYHPDPTLYDLLEKYKVLAIEMEAYGLYGVCAEHGGRALAICTVSDEIKSGKNMTPEERQCKLNTMIEMGLDVAVDMDGK